MLRSRSSSASYTLDLSYVGRAAFRSHPNRPPPGERQGRQRTPQGQPGQQNQPAAKSTAILIAAGPDEFYFGAVGGGIRIAFTPTTPGPPIVGLGDVQQGKFVEGQWRVVRQLGGDDTGQGEILTVRPNTVLRVTVYRYE